MDVFQTLENLQTEEQAFPEGIDPGIELQGSRVLIQLRKEKEKTSGGIILTSETKATDRWNETVGKVRQVGPLAYKDVNTMDTFPEGPWCQNGDIVRTIKYNGDRFVVPVDPNDKEKGVVVFVIVQASEIIAKIKSYDHAAKQFPAFIQ